MINVLRSMFVAVYFLDILIILLAISNGYRVDSILIF
jgi:hypothetical protein